MEITIKQQITADDLLQNTKWHGETDEDNQSIENLKALNVLVTELIQKVYWNYLDTKQIAENQGNQSAKQISEEAKSILVNAVKMATDEDKWDIVEQLFSESGEDERFFVYNAETEEYLVELVFREKKWLKEGELDSVPRTWSFTEKEIVSKFGTDNLKYKLSISDWEKNRQPK